MCRSVSISPTWLWESGVLELGCVRALPPEPDPTPLDNLTRDFGRHLSSERGLSPATLCNYLPVVRSFLIERFDGKPMQFDELRPVDIQGFVVRHAQTGSRRSAQLMVTALRSFLRFLRQRGRDFDGSRRRRVGDSRLAPF